MNRASGQRPSCQQFNRPSSFYCSLMWGEYFWGCMGFFFLDCCTFSGHWGIATPPKIGSVVSSCDNTLNSATCLLVSVTCRSIGAEKPLSSSDRHLHPATFCHVCSLITRLLLLLLLLLLQAFLLRGHSASLHPSIPHGALKLCPSQTTKI